MSEQYANANWGIGASLDRDREALEGGWPRGSREQKLEAGHAGQKGKGGTAPVGPYRGNGIDFGNVGPWVGKAGSRPVDYEAVREGVSWLTVGWIAVLAGFGFSAAYVTMYAAYAM